MPGIVAHTFYPSTWEVEEGGSEFKTRLLYRWSSRTATQRDPVLKGQLKEKREEKNNKD